MMSWRCLLFGLCLFATGVVDAQSDDAGGSDVIPSRPVGHVHDEARWFTLGEREIAQKELGQRFSENNIDIYLVTLDEVPSQGAQAYARSLGASWSRSPVWCVVLKIPGDPEGFYVEAGGVDMDRELIDQTLKEAIRRARRENTEKEQVISAWRECSEGLRFIHGAQSRFNEMQAEAMKKYLAEQRKKQFYRRIILAIGLLGLLVFLVVVVLLVRKLRARKAVYLFPDTSWRTRFQGPHSGGSGIVVNYQRKKLK